MKKLLMLLFFISASQASVKNTPIQRTDIGGVTVISEKISKDKWRVTFTNHSKEFSRCAKVNWSLEGFYWHPVCGNDKTYSKEDVKGVSEKVCVSGLRHTITNKVNVIGYLKKIGKGDAMARIKNLSALSCD